MKTKTLKQLEAEMRNIQKERYKTEPLNYEEFPLDEIVNMLNKFKDKTGIQVTSIDVNYARFSSQLPEEICSVIFKQEKVRGHESSGDIATDGNEKITVK